MDELELGLIKVYIKIDGNNNVIEVNSSTFLKDITSWVEVDEGDGDRYSHAQSNYLDKPLMNDFGIYLYKYTGEIVEKTEGEMQAEIANIPPPPPDQLQVLESEISMLNELVADMIGGMFDE